MKHVFIILLLLFPLAAFTQIDIGFRAGYNHSSMLHRPNDEVNETAAAFIAADNSIAGYYLGPTIHFELSNRFALRSELQFSKRGYNPEKLFNRDMVYSFTELNASVIPSYKLSDKIAVLLGYEATRRVGVFAIYQLKWNHSGLAGMSFRLTDQLSIEARYVLVSQELNKWLYESSYFSSTQGTGSL